MASYLTIIILVCIVGGVILLPGIIAGIVLACIFGTKKRNRRKALEAKK